MDWNIHLSKVLTFTKGACSHMDNLSVMANAAKAKKESHLKKSVKNVMCDVYSEEIKESLSPENIFVVSFL